MSCRELYLPTVRRRRRKIFGGLGEELVRRVVVYGSLMLATLAAGLAMRFGHFGLPALVVKYGGSTMWAVLIYWALAAAVPRWGAGRLALVAGVIATAVEFLKLYRTPWLDAFRGTLPGVLLLGRYFSGWDIVAYWVAIVVGALVDGGVIRRSVVYGTSLWSE